MTSHAETLHGLVIQHLEHVGVGADVVSAVKEGLDAGKDKAEGSKLWELFMTVTTAAAAAPAPAPGKKSQQMPQQMPPPGRGPSQYAPPPAAAPPGRMSASGGVPGATLTPQQAAVVQQQFADTKPLIAREPDVRNKKLDDDLMKAAQGGNHAAFAGLIQAGAFVNMQDPTGATPLLAATEGNHVEAVKELLANGADVNLAKKDGTSPLICAYKDPKKKKVLKELTAGALQTLNRSMYSSAGLWASNFEDYGEDEGISQIDLLQMRDETQKLISLRSEKPPPETAHAAFIAGGGALEPSSLREGAVKLLMQDLLTATSGSGLSPRSK